jgi:hypothetical protein
MAQEVAVEAVGFAAGPVRLRPPWADAATAPHDFPTDARALVPIRPVEPADLPRARYPAAPFLAQLIAADQRVPQTRARGRVAPGEAVAMYRTRSAAPVGMVIRRSA